jgi:4-aminobutyrate aminotransferase-like enzyme
MQTIKEGDFVKTKIFFGDSCRVGKVVEIVYQDGTPIYDCITEDGAISFCDPLLIERKEAQTIIKKLEKKIDFLNQI